MERINHNNSSESVKSHSKLTNNNGSCSNSSNRKKKSSSSNGAARSRKRVITSTMTSSSTNQNDNGIGCFGLFESNITSVSSSSSKLHHRRILKSIKSKSVRSSNKSNHDQSRSNNQKTTQSLFHPFIKASQPKNDYSDSNHTTNNNNNSNNNNNNDNNNKQHPKGSILGIIDDQITVQLEKMKKKDNNQHDNKKRKLTQSTIQTMFQSSNAAGNDNNNDTPTNIATSNHDSANVHNNESHIMNIEENGISNNDQQQDQGDAVTKQSNIELFHSSNSSNNSRQKVDVIMESSSPSSLSANNQKSKKNILTCLNQRSICSNKRNTFFDSGYHGMKVHVHNQWNICDVVDLDVQNNGNHSQYEVTAIEFDSEGVLLAVGNALGYIQIFDFDEVNTAAVLVGKKYSHENQTNDRSKRHAKKIRPYIMFRAGEYRISCIRWNPQNENMLAVSFSNNNETRVFDLSSSSSDVPLFIRLVDINERHNGQNNSGNTVLRFVTASAKNSKKSKLFTGGSNGSFKLWEIPSNKIKRNALGTLVWSMNPFKENITEITHLHYESIYDSDKENDGLILIATAYGTFALFDIKKCSRKSFSSSKTPQTIKVWKLSNQQRGLQNHILPPIDWMGIQSCRIQSIKSSLDRINSNSKLQLLIGISVSLNSGWVLTMKLDLLFNNDNWNAHVPTFKVVHKPNSIKFFDDEENPLYRAQAPICVPDIPTSVVSLDKASSLVMIADVPQTNIILPSKDKRVLGASSGMTRRYPSYQMVLVDHRKNLNVDADESNLSKIQIPKGPLKHVAIHPDNEWLVLSYARGSNSTQKSLILMRLSKKHNGNIFYRSLPTIA